MSQHFLAALKLHDYIVQNHLRNGALIGPDSGIRFNYRIGRFVKSYLRGVRWNDHYYYLQAQGYWTLANWLLFRQTGRARYRDLALACANFMLSEQRDDGAWDYPNPEWKGRVATNEGTWAALGLLESYRHSKDEALLQGVLKWYTFLTTVTGFQEVGDEIAVNYFANRDVKRIPNNSITVLRFFTELTSVTSDKSFSSRCPGLLKFIQNSQKPSGEMPYAVAKEMQQHTTPHFQCYQYNAFECLNLIHSYQTTGEKSVLPIVTKQLRFLSQGVSEQGYAFYDCGHTRRIVTYHTPALAAAFTKARQLGIDDYERLEDRAFTYILELQQSDGGFLHSQRDYGFLTDRRSYPRNLTMILFHLLHHQAEAS